MAKDIFALLHSDIARTSLNHVVRSAAPKNKFKSLKSIPDLLEECKSSSEGVGTIFVECGFPLPELSSAISKLKERKETKPNKVILIVGETNAKEGIISDHLSIGISGVLSMPFSEDGLTESLKVSEELSFKGSIARLKVVTGLQIKSMLEKEGQKFEESSILKAVKNACKIFEHNNPEQNIEDLATNYYALDPAERLTKNVKDVYKGVSERVRKLTEKKDS